MACKAINPVAVTAVLLVCLTSLASQPLSGQPFEVGEPAIDFTIPNRFTGESVSLSDFECYVVLLDFFAWWCIPCQISSPDIDENIQMWFEERRGNRHGVPVQVIAVNRDFQLEANTDTFIREFSLPFVLDDRENKAWDIFNVVEGMPRFVIVNMVMDSPTHQTFEVIHNQVGGYAREATAALFRDLIDTVKPSPDSGNSPATPWVGATDLGGGWHWLAWFGAFNVDALPWIFHETLDWLLGVGMDTSSIWFFAPGMGWLWSADSVFPSLYRVDSESWIFYQAATSNPRWFFDFGSGQWESR